MSGDLVIEDAYLERLKQGYDDALDTFENASRHSGAIPGLVGHGGLSSRTRDFYDGWDAKRTELIEALQGLSDAVVEIDRTFTEVDRQLRESASAMGEPTP
ncbi:hypothetical protein [Demequina sp. NBRC 110057]|uniref:hypothetical protein n=1 Tax=Demequina sp. NBRC 110057 TaxID=1570346 RepID=UPI0009FFB1D7|nr:hypothetical protein [Demequina sp. NBRC 110057]